MTYPRLGGSADYTPAPTRAAGRSARHIVLGTLSENPQFFGYVHIYILYFYIGVSTIRYGAASPAHILNSRAGTGIVRPLLNRGYADFKAMVNTRYQRKYGFSRLVIDKEVKKILKCEIFEYVFARVALTRTWAAVRR